MGGINLSGNSDSVADTVITGTTTGTITEGTPFTEPITGNLTLSGIDPLAVVLETGRSSVYGLFSAGSPPEFVSGVGLVPVTGTATWSYRLNDNEAVNALSAGQTVNEVYTVMTADGTTQDVTITIVGANDGPIAENDGFIPAVPSFAAAQSNPFGLTNVGFQGLTKSSTFADIDGDGDLDAFVVEGVSSSAFFLENIGSRTNPSFAAPINPSAFGLNVLTVVDGTTSESSLSFVDIDGDGDLDAYLAARGSGTFFSENIGSATAPNFAPFQVDPFGLASSSGSVYNLAFVDIDGDGDRDAFGSANFDSAVLFYENIGTATNPSFAASQLNPFGLNFADFGDISLGLDFGDVDGDGDLDLFMLGSSNQLWFLENQGSATSPNFALPTVNSFGVSGISGRVRVPSIVDIDGDDDLDLLVTTASRNTLFFQNEGTPATIDPAFATYEYAAFTTGNVLANDSDVDANDVLTVTAIDTTGTLGLVTNNGDGTFGYDPNGAFDGLATGQTATDSFTYTISDGNGGTATAMVTITILGVDSPPPIATDDTATTNEDTAVTGSVLTNDSNPDRSDSLSVVAVNGNPADVGISTVLVAGALLTLNANGTYSYDPNGQFESLGQDDTTTDSFTYTIADGNGGTATATVTVTINGVNDAATIGGDTTGSVTEDGTLSTNGTLTINDPDVGESAFTTLTNLAGDYGSFTLDATGAWSYTLDNTNTTVQALNLGDSLSDSFTISTLDGTEETVSITINGTDDLPQVYGVPATSYVGSDGNLAGGVYGAGEPYAGNLLSNTDGTGNPNDMIVGTDGDDNIWAGVEGGDLIDAGEGNNTIGIGIGTAIAGSGDDFVYSTVRGGSTVINLGDGNNSAYLDGGNSDITTGSGNDTIGIGTGNNTVIAGDGDDFVYTIGNVTGSTNLIDLGGGNNNVWLPSGDNTIFGSGNNTIGLGIGNDFVFTGDGDDVVYTINGGGGTDLLNLGNGTNTVWLENGNYTITTGTGDDVLGLGTGTDTVVAGDGNNTIYMLDAATSGNKDILTGAGNDYVQTGAGSDLIDAGLGFNTLYGGTGADVFVARSGAYNYIGDFAVGIDQIDLFDVTFADLSFFQGMGADAADVFAFHGADVLLQVANTTVAQLNNVANFV